MKRNLEHKTVTIYTLSHPVTNEIFYIGQTTMVLARRLDCHWTTNADVGLKMSTYMKTLKDANLRPKIEAIDTGRYHDKKTLEEFWIQTFSGWGFSLVNYRHNTNKSYINPNERKKQRDLRMRLLSQDEITLISELTRFGDYKEISLGVDCSDERIRQVLVNIKSGCSKKIPIWLYGIIFSYYNKRAKLISNIYSQINKHEQQINNAAVCEN